MDFKDYKIRELIGKTFVVNKHDEYYKALQLQLSTITDVRDAWSEKNMVEIHSYKNKSFSNTYLTHVDNDISACIVTKEKNPEEYV